MRKQDVIRLLEEFVLEDQVDAQNCQWSEEMKNWFEGRSAGFKQALDMVRKIEEEAYDVPAVSQEASEQPLDGQDSVSELF